MTKIVLDADSFKALASDTRLQILKALDARPLTVSELSRLLDLNKATVFEHLKQLTVAELAKREDDPARKWVYYKLTWKGRNVLHPENAQIFIMLGLAALGMGGAVLQTARILSLYLDGAGTSSKSAASGPEFTTNDSQEQAAQQAPAAGSGTTGPSGSRSPSGGGGGAADQQQLRSDQAATAPEQDASQAGDGYWDSLQSTDFLIILAIVSFLVLLTLLVRSLYVEQRRERGKMLGRIAGLPPNVNDAEERGV